MRCHEHEHGAAACSKRCWIILEGTKKCLCHGAGSSGALQTHEMTWSPGAHHLCSAFISLVCPSVPFSPSLSCTCRDGECGSLMTHLLHTSLLLDHIWASRKSVFPCVAARSRHCRDIGMSSLLLSLSFCTTLSQEGPLIWGDWCFFIIKGTNMTPKSHGNISGVFFKLLFSAVNQAETQTVCSLSYILNYIDSSVQYISHNMSYQIPIHLFLQQKGLNNTRCQCFDLYVCLQLSCFCQSRQLQAKHPFFLYKPISNSPWHRCSQIIWTAPLQLESVFCSFRTSLLYTTSGIQGTGPGCYYPQKNNMCSTENCGPQLLGSGFITKWLENVFLHLWAS